MFSFKKLSSLLDKKLFLLILGFYSMFSLLSVLKMIYFKSIGERFTDSTWTYMFFGVYFTDYVLVIFFMSIVILLTRYMVIKGWSWGKKILIHLLMSILLGIFIFCGLFSIQKLLGLSQIQSIDLKTLIYYYINVVDLNFLIYFSMAGIAHTYYYLIQLKEVETAKNMEKIELMGIKLNTLQTQINPHFFFNTLNSISSLITTNAKEAQNTVANVADLLRTMLDINEVSTIPLSQELNILDKYIEIMLIRYPNSLKIDKKIQKGIDSCLVPSLIFQPILENAIKHGFSRDKKTLIVLIKAERIGDCLELIIENDGKYLPDFFNINANSGLGIRNTLDRLKILYNEKSDFTLSNSKEGVVAKIKIPYLLDTNTM